MIASHLSATLALLFISANSTHGTASAAAAIGSNTSHNVDGRFSIVAAVNDHVDCVDDEEAHVNKLFLRHHSKTGKSKKTSKSSKSRRGKSVKKCPPTDMTASPSKESATSTAPPTGAPSAKTAFPGPTSSFIKPTVAPSPSKVEASTLIPLIQTPSQSPTFTRFEFLKIVPDDYPYGDMFFGRSVATYGDTIIVGAHRDDDKGDCSGSAYIYHKDLQTKEWIFHQKLVADDGVAFDNFGNSVAIYEDTLVVGALCDDTDKGDCSGSAYIYHKDLQTKEWIFHQKLVADDGAAFDNFGNSVDIYEDTLVVGALGDDSDKGVTYITDKGVNSGSAYIYHKDFETKKWILQQKLVANDGRDNDSFGESVSIYDGTVVVGANSDDNNFRKNSGSAYVYHLDPETKKWILQQKLVAEDGAADDYFGESVAIYNGTVVVGARRDDDKGNDSGSVYVYLQDHETKEWIMRQKLVADDGAELDGFGASVAVFGDTVVVGASGDDDNGIRSGSAYIYHQYPETKEWIFQQKLVPDDGAAKDSFGESVAVFGNTAVVGAYRDKYGGYDGGSVYVYSCLCPLYHFGCGSNYI